MLDSITTSTAPSPSSDPFTSSLDNGLANKRKRKPAGTPDPDVEVVSLSPRTLLESDRYFCEICNQGFQRDQNLQMHKRRHKVPWKLLKRETQDVKKRVYVCPELSCLHHDPCHALGDLVGIKKHFRRKHSNHKQWVVRSALKVTLFSLITKLTSKLVVQEVILVTVAVYCSVGNSRLWQPSCELIQVL